MGLGRQLCQTMEYSAVGAVILLWLAAVARVLDVPGNWRLIAYLCIGYPADPSDMPDLERAGWQARRDWRDLLIKR